MDSYALCATLLNVKYVTKATIGTTKNVMTVSRVIMKAALAAMLQNVCNVRMNTIC
jgi:hypothetical protein